MIMENPKLGGLLSAALIWLGAVYDAMWNRMGDISIFMGVVLAVVTIYCAIARNRREAKEFELRMQKLRESDL